MASVQCGNVQSIVRLTPNRTVNPYNSRDSIEEHRVARVYECVGVYLIPLFRRDFFFIPKHRGISERSFLNYLGSMLVNIESLDRLLVILVERENRVFDKSYVRADTKFVTFDGRNDFFYEHILNRWI